jgi:quercetin dioxygenase-like cupin family protein
VRIIRFSPARPVATFESRALSAQPLVRAEQVAITMLRVSAGGEIGRHPTTVDQLFLVVAGSASVCGDDEDWQPIGTGEAALWTAGEEHTTRAETDLTALVVEMADLAHSIREQ